MLANFFLRSHAIVAAKKTKLGTRFVLAAQAVKYENTVVYECVKIKV